MEIHFHPLSRTTISRDIIQAIIEMINSGKLKPGAKLPSEREMMDQFQVSRSPVREALTSLTLVGLLETIPGGGTYVSKDLANEMILEQLEWSRLLTEPEVIELVEIRDPLEVQAAGLAALRATPENICKLRKFMDDYLAAGEDRQKAAEADIHFHQTLAEMSGNRLIVQLIEMIRGIWSKYHEEKQLTFSLAKTLEQDYFDIVDAVEAGDEAQAREAMRQHLQHSWKFSLVQKKDSPNQIEVSNEPSF